jgi:voltage-gated potassium channel
VDATHDAERPGSRPGQDRAAFLNRFDAVMRVPIVVSVVLPLIVVPASSSWIAIVVGIGSWLVFLVDYAVYVRYVPCYARSRIGYLDLFVVVATAPWFLLPVASAGGFVVVLRAIRLVRLARAGRGARRLVARLSRVVVVAGSVLVVSCLVAYNAERATNPEFASFGDSLWWGIVTLTTVGYGDIVPKTTTGRWAAVVIMITGIAVLGVLAGSLASFLRLDQPSKGDAASPTSAAGKSGNASPSDAAVRALAAEVSALRGQVQTLTERLTGLLPEPANAEGAASVTDVTPDDDPAEGRPA